MRERRKEGRKEGTNESLFVQQGNNDSNVEQVTQ